MNLGLVSTTDLITELISRYDHVAVVGLRERYVEGKALRTMEYNGDPVMVAGLLAQIKQFVVEDSLSELEEYDG
jgi:hypothetical protein